ERFLQAQKWCKSIVNGFFDRGWAEVLAVFFFEVDPGTSNADHYVWIIVGDIPPAYLCVDDCPNGATAIEAYVNEMHYWIEAVRKGRPSGDLIPVVNRESFTIVPPTVEFAEMLSTRLSFIIEEILTLYPDELTNPRYPVQ